MCACFQYVCFSTVRVGLLVQPACCAFIALAMLKTPTMPVAQVTSPMPITAPLLLLLLQVQAWMRCLDGDLPSASCRVVKSWRAELAEVTLAVAALEAAWRPAEQQMIAAILPYSLFLGNGLDNLAEKLVTL
jgi:hypothetical protein